MIVYAWRCTRTQTIRLIEETQHLQFTERMNRFQGPPGCDEIVLDRGNNGFQVCDGELFPFIQFAAEKIA